MLEISPSLGCYNCNKPGHLVYDCAHHVPDRVCVIENSEDKDRLPVNMTRGFVGDKEINFLLDTGVVFPYFVTPLMPN